MASENHMDMKNTYDFIIVGGGTAGCVLANRLSANGKWQVCLIEAGPRDSNPFIRIPFGIVVVNRSKQLNWKYWTVAQKQLNGRQLFWPRGRTLGGSSAINAMCYSRGNTHDYDQWAALGNPGWSYQAVLPYFKKCENFLPGANAFHGINGPLTISNPRYVNPLVNAFIHAAQQAGYTLTSDFNAEQQEGVGLYHLMQKNGQRLSNADAYLREAEKRPNVTVITHATVIKILCNNNRASGVSYIQGDSKITLFARQTVILAAGAIGSPQLLLLSGIGPAKQLESLGIPIIHPLAGVGENLQDHLDIHITCLEKTRYAISFHPSWWLRGADQLLRYLFSHQGEFTSNIAQAGGFLKSNPDLSQPDLQWHFLPVVETHHAQDLRPAFRYYGYTLKTCFLHPFSRGRVTLKENNATSPPCIDPCYLNDDRDLMALVTGFKKARTVLNQSAMKVHCLREFEPGSDVERDDAIIEYIRESAETIYHPVGTCKMGSDAKAVVNEKLQVHGIDGLRVIDASIMPTIISGNTNAPTTMIAEKGADLVLQDTRLSTQHSE